LKLKTWLRSWLVLRGSFRSALATRRRRRKRRRRRGRHPRVVVFCLGLGGELAVGDAIRWAVSSWG
jgi:hypothetical protein